MAIQGRINTANPKIHAFWHIFYSNNDTLIIISFPIPEPHHLSSISLLYPCPYHNQHLHRQDHPAHNTMVIWQLVISRIWSMSVLPHWIKSLIPEPKFKNVYTPVQTTQISSVSSKGRPNEVVFPWDYLLVQLEYTLGKHNHLMYAFMYTICMLYHFDALFTHSPSTTSACT